VKQLKVISVLIIWAAIAVVATGADEAPNSVTVVAKRFGFSPDQITVKKGQPVTLSLHSEDVTHGLLIKELGIKTDIPKGHDTVITFTPETVGTFEGKCNHFCGMGHGSMKFTVVVTE
jgi:cytochrome c oxidase subunit 2